MTTKPKSGFGRPKGTPKTGGRTAGTPNKATREFRETINKLLEGNADNVAKWLKQVAEGMPEYDIKPDPAKALDNLAKLAEFAAPKLARTEHVGDNGGALTVVIKRFSDD
jgi:hypothetical protein